MRLTSIVAAIALAIGLKVSAMPASAATIAVPENLGPWGLSAAFETGQRGVYADLADALARRVDLPIKVEFVPYGRMLEGVRTGEFDYAFGVVSPAIEAVGPFIAMVGKLPMVAVARKGLKLSNVADLHGFDTVGFLRGGSCGQLIDGDPSIHRMSQDSYETAIRKLASGRLDGWCSVKAGFDYALNNLGMTDQIGDQFNYGSASLGLQASQAKAGTSEAKVMAQAVAGLVDDGTASLIFTHYLGKAYPP